MSLISIRVRSWSTVSLKRKQEHLFLDVQISELSVIQAHEVLEQHKGAKKVAERPEAEVKKSEDARCVHMFNIEGARKTMKNE